ncbi:MAG: TPM domain-containing protein [Clostridiales bacterium]|nr:TPM domain-containing protein [Clostridiales bacterium]
MIYNGNYRTPRADAFYRPKISENMTAVIFSIAILLFSFWLMTSYVRAEEVNLDTRMNDEADLLSFEEEAELKSQISDIINYHNFDVAIVTVNSLNGFTPEAYADNYYDNNIRSYSGILLLLAMDSRDWHISTAGGGIGVFHDRNIDAIGGDIVPYLSSGDYYSAFVTFLSDVNIYLSAPADGEYSGSNNYYSTSADNGVNPYLIVWIVALAIAAVSVIIMKLSLNNARPQRSAHNYIREGSFNLTHSRDIFSHSHTTRTARPREENHSHSSTHTSSGGTSHGGGGGKF